MLEQQPLIISIEYHDNIIKLILKGELKALLFYFCCSCVKSVTVYAVPDY